MLRNLVRGVAPSSRRAAAGGVSFFSSEKNKEEKMEEEKQQQQQGKDPAKEEHHHGDMMSHSFGEGYSTRSDEEGFGGIYGGNQVFGNPATQDGHPADFDESQGSEVKEKEKARNQPH